MNLECKMDHILKTKNQKIVFYRFQNIRGEGGTMEQGEQWDSKHSRKKQLWNEVLLLLVKVLSMDVQCACHKKVDFIPLLVLREYLLSHCSSCPIVLPSPYPLSILFYKQNSEDFFRRNLFY